MTTSPASPVGGSGDVGAPGGPGGDRPIRVLVADDQQLVRAGLAALLDLEPDLEVVAQMGDGAGAVDVAKLNHVDVALMDIEMPHDGITATAELTRVGACRVLIVTTFGRPGYLRRAMAAGALGFVVKDTPAEQLAAAIRDVAAGRRVVDPQLAAESMGVGDSPLSARESEVLAAAADGASVREIAATVHLSVGTVRNHLSAAIGKTGASNRAEAVHIARDRGWLFDT